DEGDRVGPFGERGHRQDTALPSTRAVADPPSRGLRGHMTNRWDDWKAQEPPPDFAARTGAAALAERAQPGRARRLAGRRAAVACAMAAVMVAGVAWGAWKARTVSE